MNILNPFRYINPFRGLPEKDRLEEHVDNLRKFVNTEDKLHQHLYDCLSILDKKCGALLSFNSIMIAAMGVFAKLNIINSGLAGLFVFLYAVSCCLLLSVIWVHWSQTDDLSKAHRQELELAKHRKERTVTYRIAWQFSALPMLILTAMYIIEFVSRMWLSSPARGLINF